MSNTSLLYIQKFNWVKAVEDLWVKLQAWFEGFVLMLPNLVIAIVVFALFWGVGKYLTNHIVRRILKNRVCQQSVRTIIQKLILALFILTGFVLALGILGLDQALTSLLAGAGVVALTIGLALQGTLSNTFSGIILSFLPQINIGDFIETDSYKGTVEDINLRSILLRQTDNNYVIIPNSKTIDEPFKNYSITGRTRISVNCGISYDSNLNNVKQLTVNHIADIFKQKDDEEIDFFYQEFGDSSINYLLRFWVDAKTNAAIFAARDRAIIAIRELYDDQAIEIPFPIRTVVQKPSTT